MIGTEVIVEGGHRLDVFEGLDFSFNYSVSDIREPDKRQTEYTKTIKCPGTSNNNTLFGNLFEADIANPFDPNIDNIGVNFNPNKKASVQVLQNSLPVLDGSMQLRRISVTDGRIEYEVVFIGRLIDLFGAWGDKKMNEVDESGNYIIDLSEFDHLLTDTVQAASWSATVGDGYVYPLIDYGREFEVDINSRRVYAAADLRPAVYVRTLWNKIFELAGATYAGSILNNTQPDGFDFDRLVIPFIDGFILSAEELAERRAAGLTPPVLFSSAVPFLLGSGTGGYVHCSDITTENTNGQITQAAGSPTALQRFIPDNNGRYRVSGEAVLRSVRTTAAGNTGGTPVKFRILVNSVQVEEVDSVALPNIQFPQTIGTIFDYSLPFTFSEIDLNAGDTVDVQYNLTSADWDALNDHTDTRFMQGTNIVFEGVNENLYYGDPVEMNLGLPEMTIKEFFLSIVKMLNLYMVSDKTVADLYHFYTRDEFYASGQLRDWTYKLDRSQAIDITPMGLLSGREYIYTYAADEDYYNSRYEGNYSRAYGTRRLDIDNDFVPAEKVNEIVFSPTPLANDGASSRILPKIYDADISDGAKPVEVNTRILFYGGLLPSTPNWVHKTTTGTTVRTTYPYAGHWNNPITPTLDINFGLSFEYYYQGNGATGPIQFTNNNLFKAYHERQFLEIASKDSKLITAMFLLTPLDIHQLDFRNTILIDQTYYRLNKVINYNPFKSGLTKVELFKAGDIAFKGSESVAEGSGKALGSGKLEEKAPNANGKTLINGNQFEPFQGKVIGSNNVVSPNATGFFVQGDGNTVGASKNVTLIGSNCVVANGVQNVTAIGVQGITITESNVTLSDSFCKLLDTFSGTAATTAVTIEETLFSYDLPAIVQAGEAVRLVASWRTAANANTKTMRLRVNGQVIYDSSAALPTDTAPNNGRVLAEFELVRTGATTGRVQGMATINAAGTTVALGIGNVTGLDWSITQVVAVTGQNGTASANDIELQVVTITQMK
jgi:hypothetical protein